MTDEQRAAAEVALEAWAQPLIQNASVFTRGAYQSFLEQHKAELIEAIGNAVLSVPNA